MDCEWRQAPVRSGLTGGASAPVDDLSLVNEETMVVVGSEARGRADGAIDVVHQIAPSANEMVMVVSNPVLVAGNRSCGLYATHEVLLDEDPKCVVHGLTGD
jgi:type IV secretory pathway protease TraF